VDRLDAAICPDVCIAILALLPILRRTHVIPLAVLCMDQPLFMEKGGFAVVQPASFSISNESMVEASVPLSAVAMTLAKF